MFLKTLPLAFAILIGLVATRCHGTHFRQSQNQGEGPILSSPSQCARTCQMKEAPKTCYYRFYVELYPVLGKACDLGARNSSNSLDSGSQCVTANGVRKTMVAVNRMLPGPSIQVCQGDTIVVDVKNRLPGMETSIHFHGIVHKGSQYNEGVPMLTQCPIYQGSTFRYQFVANTPGTHYWRSASGLQQLDGAYGNLIVRTPAEACPEIHSLYDDDLNEHVMMITEWMNRGTFSLFPGNLNYNLDRHPESILINGRGQYRNPHTGNVTTSPSEEFIVKENRRYRFRIINARSTLCPVALTIQGHTMTVLGTDGAAVKPRNITTLISFPGERYSVVINANQKPDAYWIQVRLIGKCVTDKIEQTAILRYEGITAEPTCKKPTYDEPLPEKEVLALLDMDCGVKRLGAKGTCIGDLESTGSFVNQKIIECKPDIKLYIGVDFYFYSLERFFKPNTYNPALRVPPDCRIVGLMNNISLTLPASPILSQPHNVSPATFCNANNLPHKCGTPCFCTHKYDIPLGSVVEVILVDERKYNATPLPFTLHGNYAYLMGKGFGPNPNEPITTDLIRKYDSEHGLVRNYKQPSVKNTFLLPRHGYVIFKFQANIPGPWLLESSMIFYRAVGQGVILNVGGRSDLPPRPRGFPTCKRYTPPLRPNTPSPNTPSPNTPPPNTPPPNTPPPNTPPPNTPPPNTPSPNTPPPNTPSPNTPSPNTPSPNPKVCHTCQQ